MSIKSHHYHIPAGCHDANTAAELLGVSKRRLLLQLRELGWIDTGGDLHNLPRREYIQCGWMAIQERGYALKGGPQIEKSYRVMLLTQPGFQELKRIMQNATNPPPNTTETAPKPKAITLPPPRIMTQEEREASDIERKKALEQLAAWGLTG